MHHLVDHPLIVDKLTKMRDLKTSSTMFRTFLYEITQLIAYEATKKLLTSDYQITTPLSPMVGKKLTHEITIVPILRAGLGMSDALLNLVPNASVGHIGIYRNETNLQSVKYYEKLPANIANANIIICDPMIATANSIITTINTIKPHHPRSITIIGLVAAPQGLEKLKQKYPEIDVYVAAIDQGLNDQGYIYPGLGDAGDRLFKTK